MSDTSRKGYTLGDICEIHTHTSGEHGGWDITVTYAVDDPADGLEFYEDDISFAHWAEYVE